MATIDDLLNALQNPSKSSLDLPNNKETWARIYRKDSFEELGLGKSELEEFLEEWKESNPYNDL